MERLIDDAPVIILDSPIRYTFSQPDAWQSIIELDPCRLWFTCRSLSASRVASGRLPLPPKRQAQFCILNKYVII